MKKIMRICSLSFLLLTVTCTVVWSTDFVIMSNEELFQLLGATQNASDIDKNSCQLEWEKRFAVMTNEEKKKFGDYSKDREENNGKPKLPFHTIGQGYDKQGVQRQIILGSPPEKSGSSR